ncbi:leucine-rich repeat-containing protein [Tanacetum coccineum]
MMSCNTSTYCCKWDGVTCDRSTGDVAGLDVSCGMLKGTIHPNTSSSFFNLPHLHKLNLAYNDFTEQLPRKIVRKLENTNLYNTRLNGKLPRYIFNLHSLEIIDLSFYYFTSDIPSEISLNLRHLTSLDLRSNKLSGTLPSWLFTSTSLVVPSLSFNMFSGKVPFQSFALPSLEDIDLGHNNQLAGHIDMQTF